MIGRLFTPAGLWRLSTRLHRKRVPVLPRLLKFANFFVFKAILPPEGRLAGDVDLRHYGMGVVIHPNTTIGLSVTIFHGVTIAAETYIGSPHRVVIEDGVILGASSLIIARPDSGLTIGAGAKIGAGAVVTRDVPAGATVVGNPGIVVKQP